MKPVTDGTVLIVGNASGKNTSPLDLISEDGVRMETAAVNRACGELGCSAECVYISGPEELWEAIRKYRPTLIFNLCEGLGGESAYEMNAAALLELSGIPFTGASPLLLGLARNKPLVKAILRSAGLKVPDGFVVTAGRRKIPENCLFPLIVKPACEDASLGIRSDSVVRTRADLLRKIDELLKIYSRDGVLVEQYVDGRELNVALLGEGAAVRALEPSEIDFSALPPRSERITDYEAKWVEESVACQSTPSRCPAELSPELKRKIQKTALDAYAALHANAYGRVDLRLAPDGEIYILEYNPNPDITPGAGFSKALAAEGVSYPEFVNRVMADAMGKRRI